MKKALKQMLDSLDRLMDDGICPELGDTAVREAMFEAVYQGFVVGKPGFKLPDEYCSNRSEDDESDAEIKKVLQRFLKHPELSAARKTLKTKKERLAAFQDDSVVSDGGSYYDDYFGSLDD